MGRNEPGSEPEARADNASRGGSRPVERFHFARPPFFTPGYIVATTALVVAVPLSVLVPWAQGALADAPLDVLLIVVGIALVVKIGALWGVRALLRPSTGRVIELHDDHALLPLSPWGRRVRKVRYGEIRSLNVFGDGDRARALIATGSRHFVYPVTSFDGGVDTFEAFRRAVRARIASTPGGIEQLRIIDTLDDAGSRIAKRPPRATIALLLAIFAAWLAAWLAGAYQKPLGLVSLGASAPMLVAEGQWYRLLSASFLHVAWIHLYLDALCLYVLGYVLERLVGTSRFLVIYLVSGAAGWAVSVLLPRAMVSVGASGAICGLLGAHAFVCWRCRSTLPGGFSRSVRAWVLIVAANIALPVVVPFIDWAAHAGGFAAGAITASLLCRSQDAEALGRPAGAVVRLAAVVLAAVYVAALGQAIAAAVRDDGADRMRVATAFVAKSTDAESLDAFARQTARQRDASDAELALAERAALKAMQLEPGNEELAETLAAVRSRMSGARTR